MSQANPVDIDGKSPPFDRYRSIQRLATERSGHASVAHVRHQLYAARDTETSASVLIKLTSKPGMVYQQNLANEIASLTTINRALPDSRYFPIVQEHGQLPDGRTYLISSLFTEFPLATTIGEERVPSMLVGRLRTTLAVGKALAELHGLPIFHVDLNPMNILYRTEHGDPVIRIVDFESSYEPARHAKGVSYDPPTTPGFAAPEIPAHAPDARADLFSLGAVLYTMLAGYDWTWDGDVGAAIKADQEIEPALRQILMKAVARDPDRRYPSIEEFHSAVATYLEQIWPGRRW